jgi:hypothetical protein
LQSAVLDEYDRRFSAEIFLPSLELPKGLPRLIAQINAWSRRAADEGLRNSCLYSAGAFEYDDLNGAVRDRLQQACKHGAPHYAGAFYRPSN